jgi:hypothetical protein
MYRLQNGQERVKEAVGFKEALLKTSRELIPMQIEPLKVVRY